MDSNLKLTKLLRSKNEKVLISTLESLRQKVGGKKPQDSINLSEFKHIVLLLKSTNQRIFSNALSLLGNCCIHGPYRRYFGETNGIDDLLVVLQTTQVKDEIFCRAWRLAGNLCQSQELGQSLVHGGLLEGMRKYFESITSFSYGTRDMVFRTMRKCCSLNEATRKSITSREFMANFRKCLKSADENTILIGLGVHRDLLECSNDEADKQDIIELVELAKNPKYTEACIKCFISIFNRQAIAHLLEGSGLTELFIEYIKTQTNLSRGFLKAFWKLCAEGAARNKIKVANAIPIMINLCHGENIRILLLCFIEFQFDEEVLTMLGQSQDFIAVLIENLALDTSIWLLRILVPFPILALASRDNLEIMIQSPQCCRLVLQLMTSKKDYFQGLLLSGCVWKVCRAGCPMDEVGSSDYAVGVIEHCLHTRNEEKKKIVSLAVPFLLQPRKFALQYKLLAKLNVMKAILQALEKDASDESCIASVVKLVKIFRENNNSASESMELDSSHLMFLKACNDEADSSEPKNKMQRRVPQNRENLVTFELDGGTCVTANRDLLVAKSPAFEAMLMGHFSEAHKDRVRFAECSRKTFASLVLLLEDRISINNLELHTKLELITLIDRLLIADLGDMLISSISLEGANCSEVYLWSLSAGHSESAIKVRAKAYWTLVSSVEQLMPALKNDNCREFLLEEIRTFLNRCVNDLL